MPTKPNKAGQQQNYVPAGNGDASGEYGDNASGSNSHFNNLNKDLNNTKKYLTFPENMMKEYKDSTGEDLLREISKRGLNYKNGKISGDSERLQKFINDYNIDLGDDFKLLDTEWNFLNDDHKMNETIGKFIKEKCSTVLSEYTSKKLINAPIESKQMLSNLIEQKNIRINLSNDSYCVGNSISFATEDLNDEYRTDGETFYHELGHGLDENYRTFEGSSKKENLDFRDSDVSASNNFITSTGKTLNDTLLRIKPPAKERFERAQQDYRREQEEFIKKDYPDFNKEQMDQLQSEVNQYYLEYKKDERYLGIVEQQRQLNAEYRKGTMTWSKYSFKYDSLEKNKKKISKEYLKKAENTPLGAQLKVMKSKYYDSYKKWQIEGASHWSSVSDMFSMQKVGDLGFCHSSSYANQSGYRGKEFFAECFSAESCDSEAVELIQKYFPEGWKAYKETKEAIIRQQKGA